MSLTALVGVAMPAGATGVASQLVVTTQPSTAATSGQPLPTQPVVTVEDSFGQRRHHGHRHRDRQYRDGDGNHQRGRDRHDHKWRRQLSAV